MGGDGVTQRSHAGTGSASAMARHVMPAEKTKSLGAPVSYVWEPRPTKLGYVPDLIRACSCSISCCQISRCFGS